MYAGLKSICRGPRSPCIGLPIPHQGPRRWPRFGACLGTAVGGRFASTASVAGVPLAAYAATESEGVKIDGETGNTTHKTTETTKKSVNPAAEPAQHDSGREKPNSDQQTERADRPGPKWKRNYTFRRAFQELTPEINRRTRDKLSSPYVPPPRQYDDEAAAMANAEKLHGRARAQVGFDTIAQHLGLSVPMIEDILGTLRSMSHTEGSQPKIRAVRVVMPKAYDLQAMSGNLMYIDPSTGVSNSLRLTADHRDSSTFVLRGLSQSIAKAADDLIASNEGVKVYNLGDVDLFDYDTKQMWPVIAESADGTMPEADQDKIWMHKEYSDYWIERPYEETPKPSEWTRESLEDYIMTIICGRLKPHLVSKYYKKAGKYGRLIDQEGLRTNLILETLRDPAARPHITPGLLKKALYFISRRGTYHFDASHLLELSESWGLPLDTDVFNIILEAHVIRRDPILFHRLLRRMHASFFSANARTWLLFLHLVQRDEARRNIIVDMYERGYFKDEGTRRRIARIMASTDAYRAFKAGKNLRQFLTEQDARYGDDWLTRASLNAILREFFMHHQTAASSPNFYDFELLFEQPCQDGHRMQTSTLNIILKHCTHPRTIDWKTALWALEQLPLYNLEPDRETIYTVLVLAMRTRCPAALAAAFWHGSLSRKLHTPSRQLLRTILLRQHPNSFWAENPPLILPQELADDLQAHRIRYSEHLVSGIEQKLLALYGEHTIEQDLANALRVAWWTMDVPLTDELRRAKAERAPVESADNAAEEAIQAGAESSVAETPPTNRHPETEAQPCTSSNSSAPQPDTTAAQVSQKGPTRNKNPFILSLRHKSSASRKRITLDAPFDPATMTMKPGWKAPAKPRLSIDTAAQYEPIEEQRGTKQRPKSKNRRFSTRPASGKPRMEEAQPTPNDTISSAMRHSRII